MNISKQILFIQLWHLTVEKSSKWKSFLNINLKYYVVYNLSTNFHDHIIKVIIVGYIPGVNNIRYFMYFSTCAFFYFKLFNLLIK